MIHSDPLQFGVLVEKAREQRKLVQVMFELTYGCNLNCVHCYNPTHKARGEMTTEEAFRILEDLASQDCLMIGFSGGELFARRDAFEIMGYAKKLGLVITILTNATMITEEVADKIKALNPYFVEISIYGATRETYEAVTRVPGSFDKFKRGIDLLADRSVAMTLKVIVMKTSYHEIDAMCDFAAKRQVRFNISTEIHPNVNGSKEPLEYRLTPEQEFEYWKRSVEEDGSGAMAKACGVGRVLATEEKVHDKVFECDCGKYCATITPFGKLNLCSAIHYPEYDLIHGSVEEGWRSLVRYVAERKPGNDFECHLCPVEEQCDRGAQDSWLEYKAFDGPCIPYFREIAEQKIEYLKSSNNQPELEGD